MIQVDVAMHKFAPGDLIKSTKRSGTFLFVRYSAACGIIAAAASTGALNCCTDDMLFLEEADCVPLCGGAIWADVATRLGASLTDDDLIIKNIIE